MARQSWYGVRGLCGARVGKAAMGAHVRKCLVGASGGARSRVLLVRARPVGVPMYWLDVATRPDAKLEALDGLLRNVWLECCGHLSEFSSGPRQEVAMTRAVDEVLGLSGSRLDYVYDFGSSTDLVVSHGGVIEAAPEKGLRVVGRNEAPTWPCDVCGRPASVLCVECIYDGRGFCCETHAPEHPCGEDMLAPVVNSPRMGVCGYAGEA